MVIRVTILVAVIMAMTAIIVKFCHEYHLSCPHGSLVVTGVVATRSTFRIPIMGIIVATILGVATITITFLITANITSTVVIAAILVLHRDSCMHIIQASCRYLYIKRMYLYIVRLILAWTSPESWSEVLQQRGGYRGPMGGSKHLGSFLWVSLYNKSPTNWVLYEGTRFFGNSHVESLSKGYWALYKEL